MAQQGNNFKTGVVEYFKGVRAEWGKITWPQKDMVIRETIFVIIITFAFTTFIYILDIILKYVFELLH